MNEMAIKKIQTEDIIQIALQQCVDGDVEAFRIIYQHYVLKVRSLLRKIVGSCADLDDLTQIVFVKIWLNLKQLKNPEYLGTWIYKITLNVAKDAYSKRKKDINNIKLIVEQKFNDKLSYDVVPNTVLEYQQNSAILEDALDKLSLKHKEVIVMHDMEDYKICEIARILDISEGTVKSRLFNARRKLKHLLIKRGIKI